MEENEKNGLGKMHHDHREEMWPMQNWRSWGSWFSWGSPVGLGLFFLEISGCFWLLHLAGIIR